MDCSRKRTKNKGGTTWDFSSALLSFAPFLFLVSLSWFEDFILIQNGQFQLITLHLEFVSLSSSCSGGDETHFERIWIVNVFFTLHFSSFYCLFLWLQFCKCWEFFLFAEHAFVFPCGAHGYNVQIIAFLIAIWVAHSCDHHTANGHFCGNESRALVPRAFHFMGESTVSQSPITVKFNHIFIIL